MNNSKDLHLPLFVAPTSMEYAAVRKGLVKPLASGRILLKRSGVGERQARTFCQNIEGTPPSCLVLLGWAGGLVPNLAVGDVVCASTALREGQAQLACQTLSIVRVTTGAILTVAKALLTPAEKKAAQASGACAVEMEAYPMATWANQRGIPFIHIRVILDSLDESLPDLHNELDASGRVRLIPFLRRLARKPGILQDLWKLNKSVRAVDAVLEKLAGDVFEAINQ